MFQELPNEYVAPSDLPEVVELGDMRKVYGTVVSKEDYLEHKDGRKFDAAEFDAHPEKYRSSFAEKASWTRVGSVPMSVFLCCLCGLCCRRKALVCSGACGWDLKTLHHFDPPPVVLPSSFLSVTRFPIHYHSPDCPLHDCVDKWHLLAAWLSSAPHGQ